MRDGTKIRTLDEFAVELAQKMVEKFWEDYGLSVEAEAHLVQKTNCEKQAITVRFEDKNISPTVYVEDAYQRFLEGESSVEEISEKLCASAYQAQKNTPEMPQLTPEEARKHVTLTLVNTENNQELLSNCPNFKILEGELSAIPRWYITEEASFVVKNNLCGAIGLTPDEILQIGQNNIKSQRFESRSMLEMLEDMMGPEMSDLMLPMDGTPQMIVLTSENKIQGASALLQEEALNEVYQKLEGNYVILPSSIHEIICIPVSDDMHPDELRSMVMDVNSSQVAPEERLSDQIFKYDGHKLTIVGESLKMDTPKQESPKLETQHMSFAM